MSLPSESNRDLRLALLAGYLLLLVVLIAGSEIRRVGDGREYLDMATDLVHFEAPSVYAHFWLYPALAAPFLALVQQTPLNAYAAFVPLNLALLATAFWIASGVLRWPALALVFFSPIIWWIDKAHTEVFTFSLLTIALVALRPFGAGARVVHPGWAVLCLAVAGTQNPPFLVLAPLAAIWLVATKTVNVGDRGFVAFCAAAAILVALHPAYYYFTIGRLSGLAGATHGKVPNFDEFWAVIGDTNMGLIPNAPVFVLAAAVIVGTLLFQAPRRLIDVDTLFALVVGALFLASFSQTKNYSHGGTPMMSRYALWLIPLVVPFLRRAEEITAPRMHRATVLLIALSCAWSLATFHPDRPEEGGDISAGDMDLDAPSVARPPASRGVCRACSRLRTPMAATGSDGRLHQAPADWARRHTTDVAASVFSRDGAARVPGAQRTLLREPERFDI